MRAILSLLPAKPGRALDVGCGAGELSKELKKRGWQTVGVDIAGNADFCFDIESADWPTTLTSQKFDLIVSTEVIEHIFSPEHVLLKLKNMLSEDGSMIITTPNIVFWKNRLKIFFGKFRYTYVGIMDFGHIRFFTLQTVRELFHKVGLKIEQENHVYPNLHHRRLDFLGRIFPGLFAYQMVFKLRR